MGYTTDDLLTRVKLYSFAPSSADEDNLADSDYLQLCDDELQTYCFPRVLAAKGEYRVYSEDQALTLNQVAYRIPARAHGAKLRDITYVDTASNVVSLPLIDPDELGTRYSNAARASRPEAVYLRDSSVCVWPTMSATIGTLRLSYFMRPGTLVANSACGQIAHVATLNLGGNDYYQLDFNSPYPSWFVDDTNATVDVVAGAGGFETLAVSAIAAFNEAGSYYVLASAFAGYAPAIGDWMCQEGTSCIPQLPDLCHPWLARRGAVSALEAKGEAEAMATAQDGADRLELRILEEITPRVDGEPKVIVPIFSPHRAVMW